MRLAIKGHSKRGKEVLNILKSLGGKEATTVRWSYSYKENFYCINENGHVDYHYAQNPVYQTTYKIYTLEEFEAKYPYKVGEKVLYLNGRKEWVEGIIDKMIWNNNNGTLTYYVNNIDGTSAGQATTMFLKPMKQKELKNYLKPGYIVEYDNGKRYILSQDIHGNVFGTSLGSASTWTSLEGGNDAIVKVYEVTSPKCYHLEINIAKLPVVWERTDVELTMQEIADKFGIDVKNLRIKK